MTAFAPSPASGDIGSTSLLGLLALVLVDEHRIDDARQAAAPVRLDPSAALFAKSKKEGLCDRAK